MLKFYKITFLVGLFFCVGSCIAEAQKNSDVNGLVMIDKRGGLVRFFDPHTYQEISAVQIEGIPHELVLSPDKTLAYVPNYGDGVYGNNPNPGQSIAVIDLKTRQMIKTVDISPYQAPHGIAVDNKGNLYVSCDTSRKLLVIDPKTYVIKAAIDTIGTGHWVAVLPDGSKAYTANKKDKLFVSVIDIKQQKVIAEVPMPNGTQGIGMSPDGRFVLAMDMSEPKIRKIDTSTDKVIAEIDIPENTSGAWDAKYSPDGKHVLVVNARERKANLLDANLQGRFDSLSVGSQPFGIEFTPDSASVLVSNHGDGTISIIDVKSGKEVSSFKAGTGIETLAFF